MVAKATRRDASDRKQTNSRDVILPARILRNSHKSDRRFRFFGGLYCDGDEGRGRRRIGGGVGRMSSISLERDEMGFVR